jgi:hypothetical protein
MSFFLRDARSVTNPWFGAGLVPDLEANGA